MSVIWTFIQTKSDVQYLLFGVVILRRDPLGFCCVRAVLYDFDFDELLRLFVISISRFINGKLIVVEGNFRLLDSRLMLEEFDFCACLLSPLVAQAASVTSVSLLGPRILDSNSLTRALASMGVFLLDRAFFSAIGVGFGNELADCARSVSNSIGSSSPPHLDQSLSIMSGSIGR